MYIIIFFIIFYHFFIIFSSFRWTFILLYQPITNQVGWITLGGRLSWIFPDGLSRASCN